MDIKRRVRSLGNTMAAIWENINVQLGKCLHKIGKERGHVSLEIANDNGPCQPDPDDGAQPLRREERG